MGIVERPDAETVTGQEQFAFREIPDSKGPLSVEPIHAALALFLVEMEEHFRVGTRCESMSLLNQVFPELDVIENLSIECDPQSALRDGHRLMPAGQIDNAQPGMGETDRTMAVDADIIRTSVADGPDHLVQQFLASRCSI